MGQKYPNINIFYKWTHRDMTAQDACHNHDNITGAWWYNHIHNAPKYARTFQGSHHHEPTLYHDSVRHRDRMSGVTPRMLSNSLVINKVDTVTTEKWRVCDDNKEGCIRHPISICLGNVSQFVRSGWTYQFQILLSFTLPSTGNKADVQRLEG